MSQSIFTYRTSFPGGLVSINALRSIAELSLARGDGKLRLISCQQLELEFPESVDVSPIQELSLIGNEESTVSIMSTAGVVDCCKSFDWLSLGAFQEVLDKAPPIHHFSLGVSDGGQSYLPTYMGDVTLVASNVPYYWRVAMRGDGGSIVFLPWALPTESSPSFIRSLDMETKHSGTLSRIKVLELIKEKFHHVMIPMEEPPPIPAGSEEALVGIQSMSSGGRSCIAIYPQWGNVSAQFLLELCLLARSEHVGMIALTPYRSILAPNISTKDVKQWRQLVGRFQLAMYPMEITTKCLVGDDEESRNIARKVLERLVEDRCHASGLSISFLSTISCGESTIRIEREPWKFHLWDRLFPRYNLYGAKNPDLLVNGLRKIRSGLSVSQLIDEMKRVIEGHNVGGITLEQPITQQISTINQSVMACQQCGTQYDPQYGDPAGGIEVGVVFRDLLDTWGCPVCESPKSEYVLE